MDHLQSCAKAFEHLLDFQYHIIIGRKGKSVEFYLVAAGWDSASAYRES